MSSNSQKKQKSICTTEKKNGSEVTSCSTSEKVSLEKQAQLIRVRAYELWEQAGRPEGDVAREKFWTEAESELLTCAAGDH